MGGKAVEGQQKNLKLFRARLRPSLRRSPPKWKWRRRLGSGCATLAADTLRVESPCLVIAHHDDGQYATMYRYLGLTMDRFEPLVCTQHRSSLPLERMRPRRRFNARSAAMMDSVRYFNPLILIRVAQCQANQRLPRYFGTYRQVQYQIQDMT